jgi:hypothetical protein
MGQDTSGKTASENSDDTVLSTSKFTISAEPLVGSEEPTSTPAPVSAAAAEVPPQEAPAFEDLGQLPETYHEDTLFLVARDPHWLFAYWDVDWAAAGAAKYFLKVFLGSKVEVATIEIKPEARNWYIEVGNASTTYLAELGYFDGAGGWVCLAASGEAMTPSSGISAEEAADFATVPFHLTLQRLMEMLREQMEEGESLVEALSRLQGGNGKLAFVRGQIPSWTDEQKKILAALFGSEMVDLAGMGSAEIDQFLRKQLVLKLSSESSSGLSMPGRLAELLGGSSFFSGMMSSWLGGSSGFGASWSAQPFSVKRERGFYMHVNAEVIFYGGTDPEAKVWIDDKPVTLNTDGTFRYHFKFPDGNYEIPIVAKSPDGVETRSATLSFKRDTARIGEVGHTNQPEYLETPIGSK